MLYKCTYKSKQTLWRNYSSDEQAVKGFQVLGIEKHDSISDVAKNIPGIGWSKVMIKVEWLFPCEN